MITTTKSAALFARSEAVVPGGVNSPVRAFGAVGGRPPVMVRGDGAYLHDADGNDYVDLVCSWGPLILGHNAPTVRAAAVAAIADGSSFGAPSERELLLCERIVELVEPIEQVRLVNSGTEATMSALRLARGVTGRTKVVKFDGCYHGHADAFLASAGSGVATLALPDSPGVPPSQLRDTIVVPYNDPEALAAVFARSGDEIAAVITEAAIGNMGVITPAPGFTATIRSLCDRYGAVFISDEVMTGFRASATGWFGVESVVPDLMTLGKVMGGGFPGAAFGGKASIMAALAPLGPVYQAGTLSGNPVVAAAGLATLDGCTPEVYRHLGHVRDVVIDAVSEALRAEGVPHSFGTAGTMFSLFFADEPPTSPGAAKAVDVTAYAALFQAFLDRGVYLPPSPYECWFTSAAHDDRAVQRIVDAAPAAAAAAARAGSARALAAGV